MNHYLFMLNWIGVVDMMCIVRALRSLKRMSVERLIHRWLVGLRVGSTVWVGVVVVWAAVGLCVPDAGASDRLTAQSLMADQLVLLAKQSLGVGDDPRKDQLTRAGVLLDLALELDPQDAGAWRLRVELAGRVGDQKGRRDALRRYCTLRPTDDAAQLAWIMSTFESGQTLEDRTVKAKRLLTGKVSSKLSKALRSRVASSVARWSMELGDTVGFTRWLGEAARLDRSNKEAARMTLDWLIGEGASMERIGQAMLRVVESDPVDVLARRQLGQLLLSQGAFVAAAQQYEAVHRLSGGAGDDQFVYNWARSMICGGEYEKALDLLSQYESAMVVGTQPTDAEPSGKTMLPVDLEMLRLVVLEKSGKPTMAQRAYGQVQQLLQERAQGGDEQAKNDLMWVRLLLRDEKPDAEMLAKGKTGRLEHDPYSARLVGWIYLRDGQFEEAVKAFAYVPNDPFGAYGVTKTYKDDRDPNRLARLAGVVAMGSADLAGVLAACDLLEVGVHPKPTAAGGLLVDQIDGWSRQMREPDPALEDWVSLDLKVEPTRYRYLEPISAKLKLQNKSSMALSAGLGGTAPSRLVLYVSLRGGGGGKPASLPPIVVDMGRRLRLEPRETIEVGVRLDRSQLGSLLGLNVSQEIGFDLTAVLDPRIKQGGEVTAGMMGGVASVYLIERYGTLVNADTIEQRIEMLNSDDPVGQMHGVAWLEGVAKLLDESEDEKAKALVEKITRAVNVGYARLTGTGPAWAVRFMPGGEKGKNLFGAIHEAAQRSDDPVLRIVYGTTQIDDPDSAAINAMLRHRDPVISSFGRALRVGLVAEREAKQVVDP